MTGARCGADAPHHATALGSGRDELARCAAALLTQRRMEADKREALEVRLEEAERGALGDEEADKRGEAEDGGEASGEEEQAPLRGEAEDAPPAAQPRSHKKLGAEELARLSATGEQVYRSTLYHLQPCKGKDEIGVFVAAGHWAHAINRVSVQLSRAVEADDSLTLERLLSSGDALDGEESDDTQLVNLVDRAGRTLLGHAVRRGAISCIEVLEGRGAVLDAESAQWLADSKKVRVRAHQGMWQRAMAKEGLQDFANDLTRNQMTATDR
jgi:hypothetical protein